MAAVDDLLTCTVCQEWFKSPRRLPCHHVYCLECLRGLDQKKTGSSIICPECLIEHVVPDEKVEGFQEDGRLKQLIEEQTKQIPVRKCEDCKQFSKLSVCDHCQLPVCLECETNHRDDLKESLINDFQKFMAEFFTEEQIALRKEEKVKLLEYKENLGTFKVTVDQEVDDMIKQLENHRLVLLARLDQEEELILRDLSKLDKTQMNGA